MAEKWFNSSFKNVQYKKHPTRKHGVKFDKYFRGSYQVSGIRKAVNFGWQSEGWTEEDVFNKINLYKMNAKTGTGPLSLKDERAIEEAKNAEIEKIQAQIEKSNMTFKDFFHEIYLPLIKKEKKRKTYSREESLFKNWMEENIGGKFFNEISKGDIENIFYDIVDESGKSIRTAEYALTTLKQIWREAKAGGYAPDIPVMSKTLKKRISQNNNARMRFLSYSEAETLMNKLKEHSLSLYEKALISLHCGLRASEVFNLRWSQVDLEHGICKIINSKGKDRSVHMSEKVKEMMQLKTKGKQNELVWPGRENIISGQISQVFRKVADQLFNKDVTDRRERVTFHSLRHTCASWMVMQGISLYLVQKVLGHSTIQVTERYAHLAPDQLSLAAGAINRGMMEHKADSKGENTPTDDTIDRGMMEHKEKNIIPFRKKA